jgi:putative ABC transport system permease protein
MSALALTLTAVGLYASLSYTLSQRRREFGVRMAIGATRFDLVRLVVQRGMTPVLIGLFIGMGVSAGVARVMRTLLFGVSPLDPVSFLTAPAVLVPVAVVACLLPAVRAGRVDPMTALRCE